MAKMTAKEKKERAEARAWLRKEGLLRPPKKPINKKKLIEDAEAAYLRMSTVGDVAYFNWALCEMLGHHDYSGDRIVISDQAVGVAKMILLAERRKELIQRRRAEGTENSITVGDVYEAVKDIYEM